MKAPKEKRVEKRKLCDLLDHPLQATYFQDLNKAELKALADDISQKQGLDEKIQIVPRNAAGLPVNTILDGHQRRRALNLLGKTETEVIVRYDLAHLDAAKMEAIFLGFNSLRRQNDQLSQARVLLRRYEIMKKKKHGQLNGWDGVDARDVLGKLIGMSGKNLNRLWNILHTPIEVQEARRAGKLRLVDAAGVFGLDADVQEEIARRIRTGEEPSKVVNEFLPSANGRHKNAKSAIGALGRALKLSLDDLESRVDEVPPAFAEYYRELLTRANNLITKLIDRATTSNVGGHDVQTNELTDHTKKSRANGDEPFDDILNE